MLEQFVVFTKGGLVLYRNGVGELHGNPINALISSILLEVRLQSIYRTHARIDGDCLV